MLEYEVLNSASDNIKQLYHKLFAFRKRYMRLAPQTLPNLLGSGNEVRIGFGGFALLGKDLLLGVSFFG